MHSFIRFGLVATLFYSYKIDINKDLKNPDVDKSIQPSTGVQNYSNGLQIPTNPLIACIDCKDESEKISGTINPDSLYLAQLRNLKSNTVVWQLYKGNQYFGSVLVKYRTGTTVE